MATGWKADLIIRKARTKLEWAKQSDSMRQLRDVAGIVAIRTDVLDFDYIERWVKALALEAEWARARSGEMG